MPAAFWEIVLAKAATPDTAVNEVEKELTEQAEISDCVKKNYDGKTIDDAFLTRLSTMTEVEKQTLERDLKLYSSPGEAARGVVRVAQVYRAVSQYTEVKGAYTNYTAKRRVLMKTMGLEIRTGAGSDYDEMYNDIERLSEKGELAQNFAAATVKAAEILPLTASKDKKGKEAAEDADIRKLSELSGVPLRHFEDSAVSASEKAVVSVILRDRLHDFILRNYAKKVSDGKADWNFVNTIADVFVCSGGRSVPEVQKRLTELQTPEAAAEAFAREYRRGWGYLPVKCR